MKPLPLRTSLTVVYTSLLAVLLTGVAVGYHQWLVRQVDRDATATLEDMAHALHGYVVVRDGAPVFVYDERDTDAAAFVHEATRYYRIADAATGRVLAQSRGFEAAGVDAAPDVVRRFADQPGNHDEQTDRGRLRISTTMVTPAQGVTFLLQVGLPLDQADRSVASLERMLAWGIGVGLLASAILGRWMAGRALAPLSDLARTTRAIDVRTLDRRLPIRGAGDELDEVAEAFNHTLDRLERSVSDMRQFSAALAHELRTPLAILRGEAELALTKSGTPDEVRRPLQTQLEEFDRLNHLITQILTLARAESGQIRLARDPVDLAALTQDAIEQIQPVASARGLTLTVTAAPQVVVTGDAGWLRRLLLILLDNAIKFTAGCGPIAVDVSAEGDVARLAVRDSGAGMSGQVLGHLFEPFYRADPARSRYAEGAGLGLALAKWIADQHRGRIDVASQPGHGSTFTVRIPATPAANHSRAPRGDTAPGAGADGA